MSAPEPVIGLVPAAGLARRLAPSPCSKEILPIGFDRDADGSLRPQVVSAHLFRKFARAGATKAFVILRDGKWDIPAYFGNGRAVGLDLAYLVLADSIGAPDTLDRAHAFVANASVVFGFPDILFGPDDVFAQLLDALKQKQADAALALYTARDVTTVDIVETDADGRVRSIALKPPSSACTAAWVCAAWRPSFTEFLHAFVARERGRSAAERAAYRDPQGDLPMGAAIKGAVDAGMRVFGVMFPHETFTDIGSPERLAEALRAATIPGAQG